MSETPLLRVRGLEVTFPGRATPALSAVDLDWREGEVLALVGASGSGKSTLARVLIGAQRPNAGEVRFRGERLVDARGDDRVVRRAFRRSVQPLFQDPGGSLDPRMTVFDAIAEALELRGLRDAAALAEAVRAGLEELGLDADLAGRFPHELSGGQRQRAALARILALDPEALVLDEPTSALDAVSQGRLLGHLRAVRRRRGLAVLLVSHDLGLVRAFADRIAVLQEGRIVECGPAADLYARPGHPYTRALLAALRAEESEDAPQEEETRP